MTIEGSALDERSQVTPYKAKGSKSAYECLSCQQRITHQMAMKSVCFKGGWQVHCYHLDCFTNRFYRNASAGNAPICPIDQSYLWIYSPDHEALKSYSRSEISYEELQSRLKVRAH